MNKSLETRKVITDFVAFANNLVNLESDTEYYYWMTEAILKAGLGELVALEVAKPVKEEAKKEEVVAPKTTATKAKKRS